MDLIGTQFSLALGVWRLRFELTIDEIDEEHALQEPLTGKETPTAIYK